MLHGINYSLRNSKTVWSYKTGSDLTTCLIRLDSPCLSKPLNLFYFQIPRLQSTTVHNRHLKNNCNLTERVDAYRCDFMNSNKVQSIAQRCGDGKKNVQSWKKINYAHCRVITWLCRLIITWFCLLVKFASPGLGMFATGLVTVRKLNLVLNSKPG